MSHVERNFRKAICGRNHLKSSRPCGGTNALLNIFRRDMKTKLIELFCRSNGQSQVTQLVAASERKIHLDFFAHHRQGELVVANGGGCISPSAAGVIEGICFTALTAR